MTREERQMRTFSEAFRREKVKEIEARKTTIAQMCRTYEVSRSTVHKWIRKYSLRYQRGERLVIEKKSDTRKIAALQEQVQELERNVGIKQLRIEFLEKLIEIAEEAHGIAIKKKSSSRPSPGSGRGKRSTTGA